MVTAETVAGKEEVLFDFSLSEKDAHRFKLIRDHISQYRLYVNGKFKCTFTDDVKSDNEAIAQGLKLASDQYFFLHYALRRLDDANKELEEAQKHLADYLPPDRAV